MSAKVPYNYKEHPLPLASPLRRLMNQGDSPTDSSNGVVDPTVDVQRKLEDDLGNGSCTSYKSCNDLVGTYNDNNTECLVCCTTCQLLTLICAILLVP